MKSKSKIQEFLERNKIVSFGGLYFGKPIIGLDLFEKEIWITQECETGHNIGVHVSCRGDDEIIVGWSELGWVLYGKKFVEKLIKEFKESFPEFDVHEYDHLPFVKNYIKFNK
jgi:hypothetical protein